MTEIDSPPCSPIYAGYVDGGDMLVFWLSNKISLSAMIVSEKRNERLDFDISEWDRQKESYACDLDFASCPDVVNAAWHYVGQKFVFLIKKTALAVKMSPGTYYPRIWRGKYDKGFVGNYNAVRPDTRYGKVFMQSITATSSLFTYLGEIFRNIEPVRENFTAYGHKSRELLILACTEVETAWRAILLANRSDIPKRYSTFDYFELKEALRLHEWSVYLRDYPDLDEISPFKDWRKDCATKTLPWYDAYNAVKHHREEEFEKANLESLLHALAALFIMQASQWGPEVYSGFLSVPTTPFEIGGHPIFRLDEIYLPSLDGGQEQQPRRYF